MPPYFDFNWPNMRWPAMLVVDFVFIHAFKKLYLVRQIIVFILYKTLFGDSSLDKRLFDLLFQIHHLNLIMALSEIGFWLIFFL